MSPLAANISHPEVGLYPLSSIALVDQYDTDNNHQVRIVPGL